MSDLNLGPAARTRRARAALTLMLALLLGACGAAVRRDAADDVQAFLDAVRADDVRAIETHLDRKALRADLKAQLLDMPEVADLHAQLGGGVGDVAVDRMIVPQVAMLARDGPLVAAPEPEPTAVARQLKVVDRRRVCLVDPGVRDLCLLTFAKQGKAWKLVEAHASGMGFDLPDS